MDLNLRDRVYVITGGSRGLGFAAAQALVAEGARVVLGGRDEKEVAYAASQLGPHTVALDVAGDLAHEATAERLIAAAAANFGRIDGALLSVGGPAAGATADLDDEAWREGFETVFLGPVRVAQALRTHLQPGASVAFVLSTSTRQPIPALALSNGLRPGLAMYAKTLADELGPQGIRVNGLLPGRIDTDRLRDLDEMADDPRQARAQAESMIPLQRYGSPDEFGRVAAFVLSPAASYLTGAMIPVDGGLTRAL